MKFGIETIQNSNIYGMPKEHIRAFIITSQKNKSVISVRPVNMLAKYFLTKGYPTKPFSVKNKTAKEGPFAGLIPINPLYNDRVSADKHSEYTKKLNDSLSKDESLHKVPLSLPEDRIKELSTVFGKIKYKLISRKVNNRIYQLTWTNKLGQETFVLAKETPTSPKHFKIVDNNQKTIMVLGKKGVNKPITADYDLLVICPPYSQVDFSYGDITAHRTQGNNWERNIYIVLQKEEEKGNETNQNNNYSPKRGFEHKYKGNVSPRIEHMLNEINTEIAQADKYRRHKKHHLGHYTCHPALNVVWHNQEFYNPFADSLTNNMPCLFVLPTPMNLSAMSKDPSAKKVSVVLIENVDELRKLRKIIQNHGFYWPTHAKYIDELPAFNKKSVKAAKHFLSFYNETILLDINNQADVSAIEMADSVFGKRRPIK